MKALVLKAYGELSFEDRPVPACPDDGVIVRVEACAICGSDVHGYDGSTGRRLPPVVMGHEAAGVIWQTGPRVTRFQKGDRVTFDSTIYCGGCSFCQSGQVNLCEQRRVIGVSCDEYRLDGAFAQYIAVPERTLYALPDGVSFAHAALVEPLSVAYHAVGLAGPLTGTVLVVGAGTIGLCAAAVAKALGASCVIVSDVQENRLQTAKALGADVTLNSAQVSVIEEVRRLTNGEGAAVSIEAVGLSQTVEQSLKALTKGGTCVLVGNVASEVSLPLQWVVTRQIRVLGSCASAGEYPQCLDMIASGRLDPAALLSAQAPLSEGAAWFDRLYNREENLIKVVLMPWA